MGRSSTFTGTNGDPWPLTGGGSWASSTLIDTGTIVPFTHTIQSNQGRAAATVYGSVNAQVSYADAAGFTPNNPEVRVKVLSNAVLAAGGNVAVVIKAVGEVWYQCVLTGSGKTGSNSRFYVSRRDNLLSNTILADDTDTPGTGITTATWIAFRAFERTSDVLLQAKMWLDGSGEPAWPDPIAVGTPTANPADGVLQAVDSTSGAWNAAGAVGLSETVLGVAPRWVADRASQTNNSSQATTSATLSAGASITTGNYLIARVAVDNSGTNGAAPGLSITDPRSNTWTILSQNNDPGAANEGTTAYLCYTKVTNAYSNGDVIPFAWTSAAVAKAVLVEEWYGIDTTTPVAVIQTGTTSTTSATTVSRTPTAAGQLFYGMMAVEGPSGDSFTPDSDTTQGTWQTLTSLSNAGAGSAGQTTRGQAKVVFGTSAQTWNTTITTRDSATIGIVFNDAVSPTVWTFDWDDFTVDEVTRVIPDAIAAVATVPAPTVSGSATHVAEVIAAISTVNAPVIPVVASPSVIAAISTVDAPTIVTSTSFTHVASVIAAISTVDAPTILASSTHAASVITAISAVNAPTVALSASHSASVISAVAAVNAPTFVAGSTHAASVITATTAVNAPTIVAGSTHSATLIVSYATFFQVLIQASSTHSATAIAATAAVNAPTVSGTATHLASTIVATSTVNAPTILANSNATHPATAIAAISAVNAPTILARSTHLATTIAAVSLFHEPNVTAGGSVTIAASVIASVSPTVNAPTFIVGQTHMASLITAVAAVNTPTISISQSATPGSIAAVSEVFDPTVLATSVFLASTIQAISAVFSPTVFTETAVPASVIAGIADVLAPTISTSIIATPTTIDISALVHDPVPSIGESVVFAEVIAALAAVYDPLIPLNAEAFHTPLVAALLSTGTTTATVLPSDSDAPLVGS